VNSSAHDNFVPFARRGPLNRETAKQQPHNVFETPLEIVNEVLLTKGEKLATLERWRLSIIGELDVSNEGMATPGYASKQLKGLEASSKQECASTIFSNRKCLTDRLRAAEGRLP
jgi:hypothetical protein